jgi:hypothetical protein
MISRWGVRIFSALFLKMALAAFAFEATASYQQTAIKGFKVLVSGELESHPAEKAAAFAEFSKQATDIEKALPPAAVHWLEHVPIWMEWKNQTNGAAEYHPSKEWLTEHGYNPEKAHCIEISNAVNFVKWSERDQPSMLLHELSHAYHHQVFGFDDPEVRAAYKTARDSKRYEKVARVHAKPQRAYAMNDVTEYFAELSEAYWGRNDFYPFTRSELKEFDPEGYAVLQKKWNAANLETSGKPQPQAQFSN